ncbi:MAG TPA: ABC transporter permease [Verrucomicrobiae bacterium]|jgi:predicted permease|nr:ABC transporter permease [Verrucomicrobiae bacterium]
MNPFRAIWNRLRSLGQNRVVKREIDEELRFHLEQRTTENVAKGRSREDAAREARKRFGNFQSVREECRQMQGTSFGESFLQDVRFGLRSLRKDPGFTTVVVLALALGIGASTAIYSVVNSTFLNPFPGPDSRRLVQIAERDYTQGEFKEQNGKPFFVGLSPPVLEAVMAQQDFFAQFTWAYDVMLERKTDDFIEEDGGYLVSPNFFELWNVPPFLGRTFAADEASPLDREEKPTRDTVIIIAYSWWQSLFGGDPRILGKTIDLSGRRFTVVGVMPANFQFPFGGAKFWIPAEPIHLPPGWSMGSNIRVFARLTPRATVQQAEAMLGTVAHQVAADPNFAKSYGEEWKRRPGGLGFWVRPARYQFTDGREDLERTLFGLLAVIGCVLLIACANVANLSLARLEKRQQEMAVRAALGAGRLRLMRQLLTESVLLACLGGISGVGVAVLGVKLLGTLVPENMPRLRAFQIDGHALGFTMLIAIATGLAFGCVPAFEAGRVKLGEALKQAGSQATAGLRQKYFRGTLVAVEFALTLVLLAGAGLMIESVVRLLHVNPGFSPQNLVRIDLELPWDKYNDFDHYEKMTQLRKILYAQLHEGLSALPGVQAVGIGKHGAWPEKMNLEDGNKPIEALLDGAGAGPDDLFRAMRVPLLAGRYFDNDDIGDSVGTVIVNETMAQTFWSGESAIGKRFGGRTSYGPRQYEVVGVVGDIRDDSYNAPVRPTFYRPCNELRLEGMDPFLVVRARGDPRTLVPAIRQVLKETEPTMRTPRISLYEQVLYDSTVAQRTYMLFLTVFAVIGLLLASLGIYSVLAYSVTRRTREIGIRMALGAERHHVLVQVMKLGLRLAGIGALAGLLAAFWLTRLLRHQLFEVAPTDPVVFIGALLLLFIVASVACLLPALRATRINPMKALKYE